MAENNYKKGFTLLEVMTSIIIIAIFSALAFLINQQTNRQYDLLKSASKLAQDIRIVQQMAITTRPYTCGVGWKLKGYGVFLATNNNFYQLKARCESTVTPGSYTDYNFGVQIFFEKNITISNLTASPLQIFFYSPDPTVDLGGLDSATITVSGPSGTRNVRVNKFGLIFME